MRTTVTIDDHLLKRAKQLAVQSGRSLGDIVDDALAVLIARADTATAAPAVALPTDGGSGLRPGVDLEDKEALAMMLGDDGHDAAR